MARKKKNTITLTDEMQSAINIIKDTDRHIFITGKAGTGKTTLLRYIREKIKKKIIVAASTGIAAVNAGGVTLHSLLQIPLGCLTPSTALGGLSGEKAAVIKRAQALVIDEVSMVRPDVMDFMDRKLRAVTGVKKPFGGLQLIMFGDLHQLPPVIRSEDKAVLSRFYEGDFFFQANVFRTTPIHVVQLTNIFRQNDSRFIDILNNVRACKLTERDYADLGKRYRYDAATDFSNGVIHVCTHRQDAAKINMSLLGKPTHKSAAKFKGKFSESSAPCDTELALRVGARVMTLVNNTEKGYVNGSLGYVAGFVGTKRKIDAVVVELDSGDLVQIKPYTWEASEYVINDKGEIEQNTVGSCVQFPLALAWAITIHKSQGLTFDKVVIHGRRAFCPGQIYVALSRCRSLDGVTMDSAISSRSLMVNPELQLFEEVLEENGNVFGAR